MKKKTKVLFIFIIIFLSFISLSYGVTEVLLSQAGQPLFILTITGSGAGSGTITSDFYGINCTSAVGVESGTCSTLIPMGTTVVLTATGDATSVFIGWTGAGCSGTGTCSILINGNKTADAEFTTMPLSTNLIGWYRFTEGAGTTVYNYASNGVLGGGLLPNLTVTNGLGNFWTYLPGFGSTPIRNAIAGQNNYARATFLNRPYGTVANGYSTLGLFWRHINPLAEIGNLTVFNMGSGFADVECAYINIGDPIQDNRYLHVGVSDLPNIGAPYTGGEWLFFYVTNTRQIARVRSNGTRLLGTVSVMGNLNVAQINVGVDSMGPPPVFGAQGSYADVIIYNFTQLTDTQWKQIYNQLRGRYSMAAPSGW